MQFQNQFASSVFRSPFLAAFLAVSLAAVVSFGANQAHAALSAKALDSLAVISKGLDKIKKAQDGHIIAPNDKAMFEYERQIKEARKAIEVALIVIASSASTDSEKARVAAMTEAFKKLFSHNDLILNLSRTNNDDEAKVERKKSFAPLFEKIQKMRVELL